MNWLRGMVSLIVLASLTAHADMSDQDYWKTTNVSFRALKTYLNDLNCYGKPQRYMGCIDALQILAQYSARNPRRAILPPQAKLQPNVKVISQIEGVMVVENPPPTRGVSNVELVRDARIYQRYIDTLWFKTKPGHIENLVTEFTKSIPVDMEPSVAGRALNAYFNNAVDPHTYIVPAKKSADRRANGATYIGIAATFTSHAKGAFVQKVTSRGPAAVGGLKPADIITAVDGKPITGLGADAVNQVVVGPIGGTIQLSVERGGRTLNLRILRQQMVIPNVELSVIPMRPGSNRVVNYIKIRNFVASNTCQAFEAAIRNPASGVIVDLRDNGGGDTNIVACLLGFYIPGRQLVFNAVDPTTKKVGFQLMTPGQRLIDKRNLVVITNQNSASASEVFAGTIQDYLRGFVVGTRTYGKGSVQSVIAANVMRGGELDRFPFTGVNKAITTSRYHLASGRSPQGIGITPDFTAYWSPEISDFEKLAVREGEIFRYPLSPGNSIRQPLNPKLARVRDCVKTTGSALTNFNLERDYQLQVARDVISCMF